MICCILENYQTGDFSEDPAQNGGIVVPEVLRPFMPESESVCVCVCVCVCCFYRASLFFRSSPLTPALEFREFIPFVAPKPVEEEDKAKAAPAAAAAAAKDEKKKGKK